MPSPDNFYPCLPQDLVDKIQSEPIFFISHIFLPYFAKVRPEAVKLAGDPTLLNIEIVRDDTSFNFSLPVSFAKYERLMDNMQHFRRGDGKNFLHSAIRNGDRLLAYETMRLGINIDAKDAEGVTPLFFALAYIFNMSKLRLIISTPYVLERCPTALGCLLCHDETFELQIARVAHIATLLIEQHADVNAGAFGFTPLTLAITIGNWDLVTLLLQHGAFPPSPQSLELASWTNIARSTIFIVSTRAVAPRPSRPCPCWSGKPLSDCHAASKQPYPDHCLCCCGKRRAYGACCGKRGLIIQEKWDEESGRMIRIQAYTMPSPEILPEVRESFVAGWDIMQRICERIDPREATSREERWKLIHDNLVMLGWENHVDPAFWYAMRRTDFFARPWATQVSSLEGQRRMEEWNAAVDSYIDEVLDMTPVFEIEMGAKIDSRGGPLYKRCEAEGCKSVEGRDVDKMKCCSGCKLIVYCSRECQSRDWKRHKKDCGPKTHRVQLLHSQWTLEQFMAGLQATVTEVVTSGEFGDVDEAIEHFGF